MIATWLLPWWAWIMVGFALGVVLWGWAIVRSGDGDS